MTPAKQPHGRPVKTGAEADAESKESLIVMARRACAHPSREDALNRRLITAYLNALRLLGHAARVPLVGNVGRHPKPGIEAQDVRELGIIIRRARADESRPAEVRSQIVDQLSWAKSVLEREVAEVSSQV